MKRITAIILTGSVLAVFCAAQTAPGTAAPFRQEGIASWYGSEFDGQPTASGELFDSSQLTAAHPELPFGTMLLITNSQNNNKVTVRVNDRGPFASSRIIDISQAAAERLDMIITGTAPVVIEIANTSALSTGTPPEVVPWTAAPGTSPGTALQPVATGPSPGAQTPAPGTSPGVAYLPPAPGASPGIALQPVVTGPSPGVAPQTAAPGTSPGVAPPIAVTPPAESRNQPSPSFIVPAQIRPGIPPAGTNKRYRLQVGSYKNVRNATQVFDTLKRIGLNPAYERPSDGEYYRVVLPGLRPEEVPGLAEKLGVAGFREALLREER
ncbi:MAG: septal ring lytic transglycosylase RlpA family protein [Treponema sp.]|nr:septal ring lytic transglycosylase RlpA family protein [Treponema sp.]